MKWKRRQRRKTNFNPRYLPNQHYENWQEPLFQLQEVEYIDKYRNIAISLGEKDVKSDIKAKNRYKLYSTTLVFTMNYFEA